MLKQRINTTKEMSRVKGVPCKLKIAPHVVFHYVRKEKKHKQTYTMQIQKVKV